MEVAPFCPRDTRRAIDYIKDVQAQVPSETSHQFLKILNKFAEGGTSVDDVLAQVRLLFGGYPDLLKGFEQFLPESRNKEDKKQSENGTAEVAKGEAH